MRLIQFKRLAVALLLGLLAHTALQAAGEKFTYDGIKYEVISATTCKVVGYTGTPTSVEIPEGVPYGDGKYKVDKIDEQAFANCRSLTSIILPERLSTIGSVAFWGCSSLTSIILPESLTKLGSGAFEECSSLSSIILSESLTELGDGTFANCSSLTSITLPEGLTEIGAKVFGGCSSLSSITLPEDISSIGDEAFKGCAALKYIAVLEGDPFDIKLGKNVFHSVPFETCLLYNPTGSSHLYEIADQWKQFELIRSFYTRHTYDDIEYKAITPYAYKVVAYKGTPTSVNIPAEVPYISNRTLKVTQINKNAFSGCSSLSSITLPESLTKIGSKAFSECSSLTSIDLSGDITEINKSAFDGCSSLSSITLPKGLTKLGSFTFNGCSSLSTITLPKGVTELAGYVFSGCTSLNSITLPKDLTIIGAGALNECRSLNSINLPEGVIEIGYSAFSGCRSLNSITIPESVTTIAGNAFSYCTSLSSIILPEDLTQISYEAFHFCSSLTSITLPEKLTKLGKKAFWKCTALKDVTVQATNPADIELGATVFYGVNVKEVVLHVPEGTVKAYGKADQWKEFGSIKAKVIAVTGVTLDATEKTVGEGDSFQLTATVKPANATNQAVTWKSSDASVASVDTNGNVKALKAGTTTITATTDEGAFTAACDVTVTKKTAVDTVDAFDVKVYPNPANDYLMIEVDGSLAIDRFMLFTMNGERVLEGSIQDSTTRIDVATLSEGSYILVIGNERYKVMIKR